VKNTFVVGSQWGDESKGKFVDILAERADIVARGQGGPNAGHTVVVGDETFKFHLLPSGVIRRHVLNVIGNGVVVAVERLLSEMDAMAKRGYELTPSNLLISDRAHLILPYHIWMDSLNEESGKSRLGTTKQGVGPAYADKARRVTGVRMCDLMEFDAFEQKLLHSLSLYANLLGVTGESLDIERFLAAYRVYADRLRPYVVDTTTVLDEARRANKTIVFEGAQGSLLDVDFGSYPYVTSSNTTVGGVCTGLGVPATAIQEVLAVVKAYTTRVGDGPFPTEMDAEFGDRVRRAGNEFGTTTGRPRRCGWLDAVGLCYASRLNGFTQLGIAKLDVLDRVETLRIAVAYEFRGNQTNTFPASLSALEECRPIYEEMPGWQSDTTACREYGSLPENARRYLARIEELLEVPVTMISVGPKRHETIYR
jgi:adenylosuccinate synthase